MEFHSIQEQYISDLEVGHVIAPLPYWSRSHSVFNKHQGGLVMPAYIGNHDNYKKFDKKNIISSSYEDIG